MTITKAGEEPFNDEAALALAALGWVLADERRARRFLDLTGLTPDGLRAGLADPAILNSVFDFLRAHEPDLLAAAESLAITPQLLANAGMRTHP